MLNIDRQLIRRAHTTMQGVIVAMSTEPMPVDMFEAIYDDQEEAQARYNIHAAKIRMAQDNGRRVSEG